MLAWIEVAPVLLAMVAAVVLPGYFWVRSSIRSSVIAAAAAPSLTFAVITVTSIVWHRVGVPWSAATVLPLLAVIAVAGLGVFLVRRRSVPLLGAVLGDDLGVRPPLSADAPSSRAYRILPRRTRIAVWCLVALGWVLAALPMLVAANPRDPVQQWDPTFHMNGVWNILRTQQAQPSGGLSPLYDGTMVTYPITWHAFTALFSTPTTVVQVSNATTLLLMGVWVVGATAFTAVVSTSRVAVLAAPVIAGCLPNMPADALTMYNQWPNAMGVAALPGVACLAVVVGRRITRGTEAGLSGVVPHLPLAALTALAAVGMVGAHPAAAFSLVVVLLPPALASLWRLVRRSVWLGDVACTAVSGLVMVGVIVGPLMLLSTDKVRAMGDYPRHGISWAEAFAHFLTPYPPFDQSIGLVLTVTILAVLSALGAFATVSAARRWNTLVERSYPDWRRPFTYARPVGAEPGGGEAPSSSSPDGQPSAAPAASVPVDEGGSGVPLADGVPPEATAADEGGSGVPVAGDVPAEATRAERTAAWAARREQIRSSHGPRPLLWPVATFLVLAALTFLAYGPDSDLRTFLLAPWYLDARRIMAVQDLALVPLAAFGIELVINWIRSQRVRGADDDAASGSLWRIGVLVGAWLLALSLGGAMDARIWAVRQVYDADHLGKAGMASSAELAMIRRMPQTLPEDALVLGDPIAGAAYTEVIGQRLAVFPQLYQIIADPHDRDILLHHFDEIHTNPAVCEVVLRRGITYFYQDVDGWYYNYKRSDRAPGLYDVDTSTGFELVDSGGTAKLWRITACGE